MDFELENMIVDGATAEEIGEYLWAYCRRQFNGKYFVVDNKRLYPIIEDGEIIGWEFD